MADLYFWSTPQFHIKALLSFLHLVIFVVCRHVSFFVFVLIFFITWYCYESRWLSLPLVMTTTVHVIVCFMGIVFIIVTMVVIIHFTTFFVNLFISPISPPYIASQFNLYIDFIHFAKLTWFSDPISRRPSELWVGRCPPVGQEHIRELIGS